MAGVALMKTAAEQQLDAEWQEVAPRLPGPAALRAAAFERFIKAGLPSRRVEDWKYTDLRALMRDARPLAAPPDAQARARAKNAGALFDAGEALRFVFVDGAFVSELSDTAAMEEGLSVTSLAAALADGNEDLTAHLG